MENKDYVYNETVGYCSVEEINDEQVIVRCFEDNLEHKIIRKAFDDVFVVKTLVTNFLINLDIKEKNRDITKVNKFFENIRFEEKEDNKEFIEIEVIQGEVINEKVINEKTKEEEKEKQAKREETKKKIKEGLGKFCNEVADGISDVFTEVSSWFKEK